MIEVAGKVINSVDDIDNYFKEHYSEFPIDYYRIKFSCRKYETEIKIYNIIFRRCIIKIKSKFRFDFTGCIFDMCTFEDVELPCLLLTGLSQIKTINCKIDHLYIQMPDRSQYNHRNHNVSENALKLLSDIITSSLLAVANDIDFTGVQYKEFEIIDVFGNRCRDTTKLLFDHNAIKINKPISLPEIGQGFTGYKVVYCIDPETNDIGHMIAKLDIPSYTKRISTYSTKCRSEEAIVLDFINLTFHLSDDEFEAKKHQLVGESPLSIWKCDYVIGNLVTANGFDEDETITCGHGIHFFTTLEDAKDYFYEMYQ